MDKQVTLKSFDSLKPGDLIQVVGTDLFNYKIERNGVYFYNIRYAGEINNIPINSALIFLQKIKLYDDFVTYYEFLFDNIKILVHEQYNREYVLCHLIKVNF